MDYWQMIGLVATGGGTLASILGVFFAVYAKQNGKVTREFIAAQNKEMREFAAATLLQLRNHISQEAQKTRDEIRR